MKNLIFHASFAILCRRKAIKLCEKSYEDDLAKTRKQRDEPDLFGFVPNDFGALSRIAPANSVGREFFPAS